jgi:putative methionine-R-sulfoxide reductase with GAF domain
MINRYESIISSVTRGIHQSIDLNNILENTVEVMNKNIEGVQNISIFLVRGKEARLKFFKGDYPEWYIERVARIPYPKGVTWKTILSGETKYVSDVRKDKEIGPAGRQMGTKSYVSMPIKFGGKTVAVININCFEKNAFSKEELKLLETVRRQIEIAFNHGKQAEAIRKSEEALKKNLARLAKKNRYESIISTVTQSVHQSINLRNVLQNAVDSMSSNIDKADAVSIYLLKGEEAVLKSHKGLYTSIH